MTDQPNDRGICGATAAAVLINTAPETCTLLAEHSGWHRSDSGANWSIRGASVTLPLDAARALFAVYRTWQYTVGTFDPGDGHPGMAGLISIEDDRAMEDACGVVEPHEPLLKALLDPAEEATR